MQQHFAPRPSAGPSTPILPGSASRFGLGATQATAFVLAILPLLAFEAVAQGDDGAVIEEVVVTGTHIRGATISGVLPVSVMDAEDISGGVNSARGDTSTNPLTLAGRLPLIGLPHPWHNEFACRERLPQAKVAMHVR